MVQPRAGGSRKVVDSDEDEAGQKSNKPQKSTRAQAKSQDVVTIQSSPKSEATPQPSASSTPQKPKAKPTAKPKQVKDTAKPKGPSKPIYSFFNAATQADKAKSRTPEIPQAAKEPELEDIDDVPSDAEGTLPLRPRPSLATTASRKRSSDGSLTTKPLVNGSHKYFKANDGSRIHTAYATPVQALEQDTRPWTQRYGPKSLEELVVHKKKVADVRQWLTESLGGHRHRRLLILKGSAGSGKTATLSVLSKVLDFELAEWKNPTMADFGTEGYSSLASQFEDFIGRGRRFGGLDIVGSNGDLKSQPAAIERTITGKSQVLLIEEFPNNLQRTSLTLQAFRSTLLQYLSTVSHSMSPSAPLVLVISESVLASLDSSVDKFTAHRLLGADILNHPSSVTIEYNTVAPTFISKAMSLILQKRSRDAGNYYSPHPDVLKKLAEFGDVRNATSTLEFVCSQPFDGSLPADVNGKASKSRPSKRGNTAEQTSMKEQRDAAMSLVSLRESTVGLFHAVGKIVWNKRVMPDAAQTIDDEASLPPHLADMVRRSKSEADVDTLINETGTDTQTFLSALHENFVLSTMPPSGDTEESLAILGGCLEMLGDADILSNVEHSNGGRAAGAGEALRQADLAFHVGTKGVLFKLPHPVSRKAPPGRAKASAYQMFYPSGLKLWREKEEMKGLLYILTHSAMSGTLVEGMMLGAAKAGTPVSQPGRMPSNPEKPQTTPMNEAEASHYALVGSGSSPANQMLIERLPYIALLLATPRFQAPIALRRQIERVTRFTGAGILQDEPDDDEDQTALPALPVRQRASDRGLSFIGASTEDDIVAGDMTKQQQALADDDIEDD